MFINILVGLLALVSVVFGIGYIHYKSGRSVSWEEGVKKCITGAFNFFYEELSGKMLPEKIVNTGLVLSNEEVLELTKRFDGHPYDTPVLESYTPNINGILWIDIQALGLVNVYKDLTTYELAKMAVHIIQTFYMETRQLKVYIGIKVASPTRLYFAIPLSEEGRQFLIAQGKKGSTIIETDKVTPPLEEEIDIFEDNK